MTHKCTLTLTLTLILNISQGVFEDDIAPALGCRAADTLTHIERHAGWADLIFLGGLSGTDRVVERELML